jgi:hypothetical protein
MVGPFVTPASLTVIRTQFQHVFAAASSIAVADAGTFIAVCPCQALIEIPHLHVILSNAEISDVVLKPFGDRLRVDASIFVLNSSPRPCGRETRRCGSPTRGASVAAEIIRRECWIFRNDGARRVHA